MAESLVEAERALRQPIKEVMLESGLTDEQRHHRVGLVVGSWLAHHGQALEAGPVVQQAVQLVTGAWLLDGGFSSMYTKLGWLLGAMKAEIDCQKVSA